MLRGCLIAPFKIIPFIIRGLINGVKWCINAGVKGWIILGVVGFILLLGTLGQCSYCMNPGVEIPPSQAVGVPSKAEAPYYAKIGNEIYYTEKYHWQGSVLIIENYWKLEKGEWVNSEGRAKAITGKIKVYPR